MIRRRDTTSSPANLHPRKYSPRRQPAEGEPTRSHDGVNGSRILATGGSWKLTTLPSSGSSVAAMGMRPRSLWCCRLEGDDPSSTCRASRPPPGPWSGWSRAGRRPPRPRHHTVALGNVEVRDGTAHRLPVGDASVDLMDRQGRHPVDVWCWCGRVFPAYDAEARWTSAGGSSTARTWRRSSGSSSGWIAEQVLASHPGVEVDDAVNLRSRGF